jgi:hypothetical protein
LIPDTGEQNNHVIDLISTAAHHMEEVETDGVKQKILVLDPESLYWATRSVNSNTFGRFVYELKNLESLAFEAVNHMTLKRAAIFREQILRLVEAYKKSIDGKASESIRDKHNSQLTLIDKLSRNKQERVITLPDELKQGFLSGFVGKESQKE